MILISQDGYEQINFDNVKRLMIDDSCMEGLEIVAEFIDGTVSSIGEFKNLEYGMEVFLDLLMEYRGNAIIQVPKDKKNRTALTDAARW